MVGSAGHGIGHASQPQLVEARQEFLVVLMAEDGEHPFCRIRALRRVTSVRIRPVK